LIILKKIKLTRAQLDAIPDNERRLFILVSHAANELSVLSKLFHFTASATSENPVILRAENIQALVLGRLLTGKIYECWMLLQEAFFKTALSKMYEPKFDEDSSQALKALKRYFGPTSIIELVRKKYAFHYSLDQVDVGYSSLVEGDPLDVYFSESNANTLYEFGDSITNRAMLEAIFPGDHQRAFEILVDDTASAVEKINIVIGMIMTIVFQMHIGNDLQEMGAETVQIEGMLDSQQIYIPYFIEASLEH
jgi:hypothetical protein